MADDFVQSLSSNYGTKTTFTNVSSRRGACSRLGGWVIQQLQNLLNLIYWLMLKGKAELRLIFDNTKTRSLFLFVCCSSNYIFIELVFGYYYSSLALIAHATYNMFATIELCVNLMSMLVIHHRPTHEFTYGFWGVEALGSFTNGIMHLFLAIFSIYESAERFLEGDPPEIGSTQVIALAFIGLVLNLVGGFAFHRYKVKKDTPAQLGINMGGPERGSKVTSTNILLVDILVSLLLIVAIVLSTDHDLPGTDALVSIAISLYVIYCAFPLAKRSGMAMLQTTPDAIKGLLDRALSEASAVEGVLECHSYHFWTETFGVTGDATYIGSLIARVRNDVDEQIVLTKLHKIFNPFIGNLTIEIEKDRYH